MLLRSSLDQGAKVPCLGFNTRDAWKHDGSEREPQVPDDCEILVDSSTGICCLDTSLCILFSEYSYTDFFGILMHENVREFLIHRPINAETMNSALYVLGFFFCTFETHELLAFAFFPCVVFS